MKKICVFLLVMMMLGASQVFAQNALLRHGDRQYEMLNYKEAAELYEQAYSRKAGYRSAKKAAQAYEHLRDYDKTFEWWKITADFDEATLEDKKAYALAAQKVGEMEEFEEVKTFLQNNNVTLASLDSWDSNRRAEVKVLEPVNTAYADFGMAMDNRGNKYFTSDRGQVDAPKSKSIRIDGRNKFSKEAYGWTGRDFLTIYRMDKEDGLTEINSPVPNTFHFSDPFFMKDKPVVFYTVTREVKGFKKREYNIHPELYYSEVNEEGEFVNYKAFPLNSFQDHAIVTPFVDEENKRIYFASDMKGGLGGLDLYYVSYDEDFKFGNPVNLGPEVNTAGNERNPFLIEDRFYFSSDGHEGMGGLDIFTASYTGEEFSQVSNMGRPYNSPQDDFAFFQREKGKTYISSDRKGGQGLDDIYLIEELYKRFLARVVDCDGELVNEEFMFALEHEELQKKVATQSESFADFAADIDHEADYRVSIRRDGYFPREDAFTTRGFDGELLEREYTMVRIPYRTPIFVDLVYYDLDRAEIREEAKPTLNKLAEMMKTYSYLDLMVKSHTDSRASQDYNEKLSKRRADAVVSYLTGQGVPKERVSAEWFGKKQPVNDCADGKRCPEADHQLNRRSELVLQAFPEDGKDYELPVQFADADCEQTLIAAIQEDLMEKGLLAMPKVYFDFDRYSLRTPHKMELERLAVMMQHRKDFKLSLEGHTDLRGSEAYNKKLSERRAEAVFQYLLKRGVDEDRLAYEWFGMSRPVNDCSSCTEKQHQENRRTEVHFMESMPRTQVSEKIERE